MKLRKDEALGHSGIRLVAILITHILTGLVFSRPAGAFDSRPCASSTCLYQIDSETQFRRLGALVDPEYSTKRVVKIVYRRDQSGRSLGQIYFVNMNRFEYHLDFVRDGLGLYYRPMEFNQNYVGPGGNREFNLASLVYDPEVKTHPFVLELWSGDELSGPFLKELIQRVRMATTLPLVFHPVSLEQEAVARRDLFEEDFVLTEDLYQGRTYWALNRGEAIGYLRLAEAAQCMDFKSIALFKKVPNDLGLVGGVITEEFQTPLSHVNVKSMNRGTVNMSLLGASGILGDLIDQPIRLFVGSGDYKVEPLDPAQAENQISRFWQKRRPLVNVDLGDPPADSDLKQFSKMFSRRPSPLEHQKLSRTVGAKATNLGLLHAVLPPLEQQRLEVKVPDGFGVPFAYFQIFLNTPQTGLDSKDLSREMTLAERVKDLLDQGDLLNPQKIHTTCEARPTLVQVREVFGKAKVPDALIAVLKYQIMENSESPIYYKKVPRIRLRSSTNSEDLDGFTGAGLYNSEGISFYKKDSDGFFRVDEFKGWKKIEEKLRELIPQIYAGVWNDRAYEEREWYQINGESHLKIQVGMAVHQAFYKKGFGRQRGEVANGVAIGRDIYTPNQEAKVYLNSQHGDLSVTNPPTEDEQKEYGIDPEAEYRTEEKIVTTFLADPLANSKPDAWKQWPVERLKTSTVNHGDEVLKSGDLEARRLARVMEYLDQKIAPIYETPLSQFALDVEWKLMGENRQLWIKQARPFSQPRVLSVEETDDDRRDFAPPGVVAPRPTPPKRGIQMGPRSSFTTP